MLNSVDPDQLASSELIWISTVCKGRVYPGSAGQGLIAMLSGISFQKILADVRNRHSMSILDAYHNYPEY